MTQQRHGALDWTFAALMLFSAALLFVTPAHASTGTLADTTVAEFSAGSLGADTYVGETGDGEVMLSPAAAVEFYGAAVPPGWTVTAVETGGGAVVQGGALLADGARFSGDLAYGPGRSVEFVATFGAAESQSAGFGDLSALEGARWAIFSTLNTSTDLYVSSDTGAGDTLETQIPGSFLGTPHRYRIDWNLVSVDFLIDGALVASHAAAPVLSMPPFATDGYVGGDTLALDWLRITPYAGPGSFESRVLDAGRHVDWEGLSWTVQGPGGTAVFLSVRTGDTAIPDESWTSFSPVATSGDPVGASSRYVQYRAELASSDPGQTPTLDDVSVSYTDATPPTVEVDGVSDALLGVGDAGTDVTWHADEDGAFTVRVGGDGCPTGDEVQAGTYAGSPAEHMTAVSAAQLAEGANTIRVCVTDAAGNEGSQTTVVVKDTTAPVVTVDAVDDAVIGSSDTGTDVAWHADEDGPFTVRVGGDGCPTGDEIDSGSYGGAPAPNTTAVSSGELAEGSNTVRVCVTDAAGNEGSQTTSILKDTNAPAVTIDAVSDALIGSGDAGTDVTWHAGEDGIYSVRVGGEDCTTGDEAESDTYSTAPGATTTNVSAGQLAEGANTIRVCVTDEAGNEGSQTTVVVKDTTAPVVTVDAVSDTLLGAGDTGTDVTWHADEDGAFTVRVGGAGCPTGDEIEGGGYAGAPAGHTTAVSAAQLAEGANTIRVCVTDAAGNEGSQTTVVVKDTTAPVVTVDAVSDTLVGGGDTGTDVTWHADEDGAVSVRVGVAGWPFSQATSCLTGTVVASDSYAGAPDQRVTTVTANDLRATLNPIHVCLTDAAGNMASEAVYVVKDLTSPAVAVDSVTQPVVGPSHPDTEVTWHANDGGPFSLRVGGTGCATATTAASGHYVTAPMQTTTTVSANDLVEGTNTIRVCLADVFGNEGDAATSVVKDTTAPNVGIDAVSDDVIGPAAPASDITWQANESGTYSVRVGGTSCTTGDEIADGSYAGPPEQRTATVSTTDLTEGPNTVRICVTDHMGNQGSLTTSIAKDTTGPTVAVDGVSDANIGPGDTGTDVTWHSEENGTYVIRVSGSGCTTGNAVENGSYTDAPAQRSTTVSAGDLSEGANTIRVCVTDAAGNQASTTTTVLKDTAERSTLTFNPQADARVEEANPDTNFGTSTALRVEAGSALDIESYLRFQVAGVLGAVEQATLRLWVTNGTTNGPAAYKTSWAGAETAITWNNRAPGTSGPNDDKGAVPAGAYVDYDVTPLVTGNGPHAFLLAGTSSDSLGVSSRESSTVSQRPQLILTAVTQGTDSEPPDAPTSLTAAAHWPTQATLNWTAATDNVGATAYQIHRDGALLTTVGDVTTYTDTTVQASTGYEYEVRALDAAGNLSAPSNEAAVTTPAPTTDPVIMAAGDQACDPTATAFNSGLGTSTSCRQKYTSDLLVNQDLAAVLALGDIQYECGGYNAFLQSYDPTWGRVKSITYPVPGNHEYHTTGGMDCDPTGNALGYFSYFGAAAGDPDKGYYSFDIGAWHLIALNSNCAKVSCATSSAQANWLRDDLAANANVCTLAFWHHPRFTSGTNSPGSVSVKPLYEILYANKADLLLVGHDHDYERFALKDPEGGLDPVLGIREFVVGTGGKSFHAWGVIQPGSEARNNDTFGVLKLILSPAGYEWRFVPEAGKTYTDTGSAPCSI